MSTTSHKERQNTHLTHTNGFKFQGYHHEAVELRYQGKTYREIATLIAEKYKRDFKDATVRAWFARGNILDQPYIDFAKSENERRRQHVREEMKKLVSIIPQKYEKLLRERFVLKKDGAYLTDHEGNKVEKLDIVTVAALRDLGKFLGLEEDTGLGKMDPIDRYFGKLEEETQPTDEAETPAP